MSSEQEVDAGDNVLNLSFLDVLCCGLGGAICLFLVFSVMPHRGKSGGLQQGQSTATSGNGDARVIGAQFEEFRDRVRFGAILIRVDVSQVAGTLADDAASWQSFPNDCSSFIERLPGNKVVACGMFIPKGMNPNRSGRFQLKCDPAVEHTITATAQVGGSLPQSLTVTIPTLELAAAQDPRDVFEFRLFDKDKWISSPYEKLR